MDKLRIIVGGYIGLYPTGGATWDYLQYPLGLALLGHDVYYVEDTMQYPVFQQEGRAWDDATVCVDYLRQVMQTFNLQERWAYRDVASGRSFGLSEEKIRELCSTADVFINISCSTYLRDEYLKIQRRVLIDSDPMFTQMQYELENMRRVEAANWSTKTMIENHTHLFSFGENINEACCKIPRLGFRWHTTRQPVCLDLWRHPQTNSGRSFTSVMNWAGRKKLTYKAEEWGQKDVEFEKIKTLPCCLPDTDFVMVINKPLTKESSFNAEELIQLGWKLFDPQVKVGDVHSYKNFIQHSTAEFSVAKETYVKSNSGWFSCRCACYLAAGKPVVTQDTGWSRLIPSGEGLFSFDNAETAIEAIKSVQSNITYHSAKATEIAAAYFDSKQVLTHLLEQIN